MLFVESFFIKQLISSFLCVCQCIVNANYELQIHVFMVSNRGQRVTQFEVEGLFGVAYNRSSTAESLMNWFRSAGIWPFDRHRFDAELPVQAAPAAVPASRAAQALPVAAPLDARAQPAVLTPPAALVLPPVTPAPTLRLAASA